VIVTAMACLTQRVFDIMKVKPSCVIADVARPLDLPASEVAKRPDVLVIESGESGVALGPAQKRRGAFPHGWACVCHLDDGRGPPPSDRPALTTP